MHIAIDDTYGPNDDNSSRYVSPNRRTSVAIVFQDYEIESIRKNIKNCLSYIQKELHVNANEFHFTEIYNRRGPWKNIGDSKNIRILTAFAEIYCQYKWPVHIQTIDDRILSDHGIKNIIAKIDSLDLSDRSQLSLAFLLMKVKKIYFPTNESLTLFVDEGIGKPGQKFGEMWFRDWPKSFTCNFESTISEPLLQLADFLAFSINRITYLLTKENRTDFDLEILNLLSSMDINCPDLVKTKIQKDFTIRDIDKIHDNDRRKKGLKYL